jgi:predicted porin
MKKTLIAAAVLATAGSAAFAQSSVTIYGRVNLTVERQKLLGENDWVMQNSASRIGFKGTEDLGGGLKAGFQIEHGFNPATGRQSQTAFWARQSEVNLSSNFGMVRLGNFTSEAYYATSDYIGMHNHETGTSSDAFYAYIGRNTSKVSYRTPSFGGATVELAVTEAGTNPERTYDLAANYDAGPLHLGAGYEKNGDVNQFAFRVLYELGAFTVGAMAQRDEDGWGAGFGKRTNFRLSGMYTTGNTELHLNVGRAGSYSNSAGPDSALQYTLGVNYNLSKRTKVYGFFTKVSGDGADFYAVNSTGVNQSLAIGVRHNF